MKINWKALLGILILFIVISTSIVYFVLPKLDKPIKDSTNNVIENPIEPKDTRTVPVDTLKHIDEQKHTIDSIKIIVSIYDKKIKDGEDKLVSLLSKVKDINKKIQLNNKDKNEINKKVDNKIDSVSTKLKTYTDSLDVYRNKLKEYFSKRYSDSTSTH